MKTIAHPWVSNLTMYEPGKPMETVARELGFESIDDIIKLASNENVLGPSPKAVRAMKQAATQMHLYPDSGAHLLRQKLAAKLGVSTDQLLITNGSNEVIEFMGHIFLGPGTEMVMADRGFAIYHLVAAMFQAKTVFVPMRNYTHDLDAMLKAITPKTKIVFIANPNNPTGTMVSPAALDDFMARVPSHVVVGLDEAYIELLTPDRRPDSIGYVKQGKQVIILRTFSKTYGLAGLRIGYAVTSGDGVALMHRVRQPFNVTAISQIAATAALDDDAFVRKTQKLVRDGVRFFEEHLPQLGLPYVPAVTNFMLVETGNARTVFQALQKEKIIVRPMDGYGLPNHIRVTVGTREQNVMCLVALAKVLGRPWTAPAA